MTKRVDDADTTSGTAYSGDLHPYTDFGIAESTAGVHRVTDYSYDAQGREDEVELPSGRITKKWYTKLGDDRIATFSVPKVGSYYGPAGYNVSNHAGQTEDCMIIMVNGGVTATLPSAWLEANIGTGLIPSDAVEAFDLDIGSIGRRTTSTYNASGTRLDQRDVYYDIANEHSETWSIGYDDVGRQIRVKEPSGTITRTTFDELGRVTARHIGTNDEFETGTDDMVKTEAMVYDGGNDGGNSLLTTGTRYVEDGTTDQRLTTYTYDYRGRLILTTGPQAPYPVSRFDNLSRQVAAGLYSSSSGLDEDTDPTSTATNRVGLSQSFYDERGQVWKSQRHKITQSTGADADNLQTLNWFDPDGRLIKTDGEQLSKSRYDRLGRPFQMFTLASDNDTGYSNVYDSTNLYAAVDGDKVLEERQIGYDDDDDAVLVEAVIGRDYDDTSTTGPLDVTYESGGDGLARKFTAADVKGRIQITAHWYDSLERPTTTAYYGTYDATDNVATFDYDSLSEPTSSSASAMVTTTSYDDAGAVQDSTDALGRVTRFEYDGAGRLVTTIGNYTNGSLSNEVRDHDIYTRYFYEDGLQTKLWVDLDGDGTEDSDDQVTEYVYGTTKGTAGSGTPVQSAIATGHLLYQVKYPKQDAGQSDADRTVTYAYNAQGEQVWTKDQEGNIVITEFDTASRQTHQRVTTLDADFDGAVRRITTTYLDRGLADKVTQYDNATAGTGAVVDDLRYTYDDWGNIESFIQDVDSDLDGSASGRDPFEVAYTYAKATAGRNTIRRTKATLPGDTAVTYSFLSTSGRLDDAASRVSRVSVAVGPPGNPPPTSLIAAEYEYLGTALLVGTDLPEPSARGECFEGASGTNPYPDLDRFNRVSSSRWTGYKASGTRNLYDIDIAYDEGSNITGIVDNVLKNSSGNRNFDALYTLDGLNRLVRAEEGTLSGGSISNRSRDEWWRDSSSNPGLSQTGNWLFHRLDLDGGNNFSDSGELDETNAFNLPNELLARDTDSDATDDYSLAYDKLGNQADDGQHYTYVYDPFGRLRKVLDRTTDDLVAEYTYNGLGFRIGWHSDVTDDGTTGEPDGTVDAHDPWYWFTYDDGWQIVATFRAADDDPKEVSVHHLAGLGAGLGGRGSSSYINSVILRDRDAGTGWADEADSTREERVYYCQNWRADVVALLSDSGKMLEWTKYSAYGVPFALPAGDIDSDGDFDATDVAGTTEAYDVRKDFELDGDVDFNDIYHAIGIAAGYQTLGRGTLTSPAIDNRRGYAGYESDPTLAGANGGGARTIYHVRHRVYDADVGRWTRRDPLGYVDGMNLYESVKGCGITGTDPFGLAAQPLPSCPPWVVVGACTHCAFCIGVLEVPPSCWAACAVCAYCGAAEVPPIPTSPYWTYPPGTGECIKGFCPGSRKPFELPAEPTRLPLHPSWPYYPAPCPSRHSPNEPKYPGGPGKVYY